MGPVGLRPVYGDKVCREIDAADPGAVPGDSTISPRLSRDVRGRTRIDVCSKTIFLPGLNEPLNRSKHLNANDNEAFAIAA